tara:strand:+ start:14681 stop:15469 length:789 start_codon:yes stop_codon:yes gene_type:complete
MIPELQIIKNIAKTYSLSEPRIVGGIPRDMIIDGKSFKYKDIDITTNSEDILRLAVLSSRGLGLSLKIFPDGHSTIFHKDFSFDFSSRFISNAANDYMKSNFSEYNEKYSESYSRDFTINSLEADFSLSDIYDPTNMGLKDIEERIIRPITTAEICLSDDPRRAYRAIKMASKYNFKIDNEIIDFSRNNHKIFSPAYSQEVRPQYISATISASIDLDGRRTFENLIRMKLLSAVPLSGDFKDWVIKNRMLDTYFKSIDTEQI